MTELHWWDTHDNLVTLLHYLNDHEGYDTDEVIAAVEKPWKYTDEWIAARDHEIAEGVRDE